MSRTRSIKPEFFDDPDVADLSHAARLFFIGLWTQADREGRLEDNPRRLKARLFPYDNVDLEALAVELHGKDMIDRYSDNNGRHYLWVRNFRKHQHPHPKEPQSVIPSPDASAVKRNGEPCKKTASKAGTGYLVLGTDEPPSVVGRSKNPPDPRVREFLSWFQEEYKRRRNGATFLVDWAKDGATVKAMLGACDLPRLQTLAKIMLSDQCGDLFIQDSDRGIGVLKVKFNWLSDRLAEWEAKRKEGA
jgi:hypothetical protein